MNTEENIAPEVKELLDALAEPRANKQRQQQLSRLIDDLAAQEERTQKMSLWRWAGIAVAAACVVLFIIRMPDSDVPAITTETVATLNAPMPATTIKEELTVSQSTTPTKHAKRHNPTLLAQARATKVVEETKIDIIDEPTEIISTDDEEVLPALTVVQETPSPAKPTRRVVACNKLVCYDCKPKRNIADKQRMSDKTIFGTPATTNMDEGMLMLASL